MLARLYVGGRDKGSERLPTQFLGRLRVSVPTAVVAEVWDHIAILALHKDNQKGPKLFISNFYATIRFVYGGTI